MMVDFNGLLSLSHMAQRAERRADFGTEQFGLFPCGEMPAFIDLVPVDEPMIAAFRQATRSTVDLAGKTVTAAGMAMSTALKLLALFSQ